MTRSKLIVFLVIVVVISLSWAGKKVFSAPKPEEILAAAKDGNVEVLRDYLEDDANPDLPIDVNGRQHILLIDASRNGRLDAVRLLIEKKANVNIADNNGITPLIAACSNCGGEAVDALLEAGANPDTQTTDRFKYTALMKASWSGCEENVTALLSHGASLEIRDAAGYTALIHAASAGRNNTLQILLDNGADWKAETNNGKTALGCSTGDKDVIETLVTLESGATEVLKLKLRVAVMEDGSLDINPADMDALEEMAGNDPEIQFLLAAYRHTPSQNDNLPLAALNGDLEAVKKFIDDGVDVNKGMSEFGSTNFTPLEAAAKKGHNEIAQLLIDNGANIEFIRFNSLNCSALMDAAESGHSDVVELFLEKGANVNFASQLKDTPLIMAVQNGDMKTVEVLLNHGADINAQNAAGYTALIEALVRNNYDIVETLVARKADLGLRDCLKRTALIEACNWRRSEVVKLLLKNGADKSIIDIDGNTALDLAVEYNFPEIAEMLEDK
ncbi:MAG: ankyrin repeat domain-containing protein [Nitrospirae bacterium]|nr:ankyrin repeat domain-containing protein [Nitrospirota bacterium]